MCTLYILNFANLNMSLCLQLVDEPKVGTNIMNTINSNKLTISVFPDNNGKRSNDGLNP